VVEKRIPLFDLRLPSASMRNVQQVLKSGWLNTGPKAAEFEKAIAARVKEKYAVALNSATAGLQATLEALGAGPGREVITTSLTFAATAASIIRTGAMPVLADIDPATLNIDPDEVARKVTTQTMAILSVDIAGHPADYPALLAISAKRRLPLIADAAHSLGATYAGQSSAQLTDAAVYSFQATKNLTTADGGMVVTRHKLIADRVRLLSQHAMTSNAYQRNQSRRWEYEPDRCPRGDRSGSVGDFRCLPGAAAEDRRPLHAKSGRVVGLHRVAGGSPGLPSRLASVHNPAAPVAAEDRTQQADRAHVGGRH
jgi:dTDP-4-amino-4,6-dideoxygalactose transaminase